MYRIIAEMMERQCNEWASANCDDVMISWVGWGCTAHKGFHRYDCASGSVFSKSSSNCFGDAVEFLVSRCFLFNDHSRCCYFDHPQMVAGTSGNDIFSIAVERLKLPFQLQNTCGSRMGAVVFVSDAHGHSLQLNLLQRYMRAQMAFEMRKNQDIELRYRQCIISISCTMHVVQSAFRTSLGTHQMNTRNLLKGCYVVSTCIRKEAAATIIPHLPDGWR